MNAIKDQFDLARETGQILHLSKFISNYPRWEDFINNLSYKLNSKKISDWNDPRDFETKNGSTDVFAYNKFDIQVRHACELIDQNYKLNFLFKDSEILKELSFYSGFDFPNIKTLINFVGNESEYHVHKDDHDVILIHCEGTVEWRIYKSLDADSFTSYLIKPGDIVFAPRGVFHQVVVSEPRASIILDHNYE